MFLSACSLDFFGFLRVSELRLRQRLIPPVIFLTPISSSIGAGNVLFIGVTGTALLNPHFAKFGRRLLAFKSCPAAVGLESYGGGQR